MEVLLISCFIFDLFFNNFQVTIIFHIIPWTFLYEIYLRFSYIYRNLWTPWDQLLHDLLYADRIQRIEQYIVINGRFYEIKELQTLYVHYIKRDFVADFRYI